VQYEWDKGKAAENIRKHGVDFMDAIEALKDPNRLEEIDTRFPYDEERIQVTVKPGDSPSKGGTDWRRIDAMTDEEVVAAALADSDAQPLSAEQLATMRRVSRVKALRQRLGMTQTEFAEAFHLPITTLRDWEQRRSMPDAPARALLLAIERDPEVMRRLLSDRAA
jgi:putative transcriptional regulator